MTATQFHAPCIVEFGGVWTDCPQIIGNIERETSDPESYTRFTTALVLPGSDASEHRSNSDLSIEMAAQHNEFFRLLRHRFCLAVESAATWYQKEYAISERLEHCEGNCLLRYQSGEEYTAHYDGATAHGRCVSVILYLNDDYEGGELEFVNFGLKIKPRAGSLYLFPSTFAYRHVAHPVTGGTKYAIVTWLHDIPAPLHATG